MIFEFPSQSCDFVFRMRIFKQIITNKIHLLPATLKWSEINRRKRRHSKIINQWARERVPRRLSTHSTLFFDSFFDVDCLLWQQYCQHSCCIGTFCRWIIARIRVRKKNSTNDKSYADLDGKGQKVTLKFHSFRSIIVNSFLRREKELSKTRLIRSEKRSRNQINHRLNFSAE